MKRILALDYGTKRIGVAISDLLGITAQTAEAVKVTSEKDALAKIILLVKEVDPDHVMLGIPLNQHGESGEMSEKVKAFGTKLAEAADIRVEYFDERFSSKQAEDALREMGKKPSRNRDKIDSLSAQFVLRAYLEFIQARGY